MKKVLILFTGLFTAVSMYGQQLTVCGVAHSFADLHGNNILARIPNGGVLFNKLNEGAFRPNPALDGSGPGTIYSAGLWIGGVDPAGNLKMAVATETPGGNTRDYFPGPLDDFNGITSDADCSNWDRSFKVTAKEIDAFLGQLPTLAADPALAIALFPNIMGWPGRDNPYFSTVYGFDLPGHGLAGFMDIDLDGIYNPLAGDFPAVLLRSFDPFVPAEQVWSVFNDEGGGAPHSISGAAPLHIEVQQTAWAFNCIDKPVLNNTVFTAHKIINRSSERLDSVFVGINTDFDIGCPEDDQVGSIPGVGFFAYNQDVLDGNPGTFCIGGVSTFGEHAPVQSVSFLNQPMDKCIHYGKAVSSLPWGAWEPSANYEFYNCLSGHFKDGTPLTTGGTGYNPGSTSFVDYSYPDDPADMNGWSMCTAGSGLGERFTIGSSNLDSLLPGEVKELVLAWTVHPDPALPCGLGTMYNDVNWLQDFYASRFAGLCSPLAKTREIGSDVLNVFPNPAATQITVAYNDLKIKELRLYSADGRLVRSLQNLPGEKVVVPVQDLTSGLYEIQLITDQGNFIRKLSIAR